jgi:streptogramin lyase
MWDGSVIEGLEQPCGSDVGPDGHLYFANCGTSEVVVVDADGAIVRRWGSSGTSEGEFDFLRDPSDPASAIGGVSVSPDGSVYVADTVNRRVQRFTPEGEFQSQFGSFGTGDGQFLEPIDLDVGPDGSVYVVDDVRDDIQRFSADGVYIQTIGQHGSGDGELRFTSYIVVTDDGKLLNADWENDRVQAWDADGGFLWSVGTRGSGPGEFRYPGDVAADGLGRWFATDFDNGRVQVFGQDNEPLGEWVVPAIEETGPGYAITAAEDGRVYVNMPFTDRIVVLKYVGS